LGNSGCPALAVLTEHPIFPKKIFIICVICYPAIFAEMEEQKSSFQPVTLRYVSALL
jgi:hypothetical protein